MKQIKPSQFEPHSGLGLQESNFLFETSQQDNQNPPRKMDSIFSAQTNSFLSWFQALPGATFHPDIAIEDLRGRNAGRGIGKYDEDRQSCHSG